MSGGWQEFNVQVLTNRKRVFRTLTNENSIYRKPTKGCHSFREETTQFACLDAFYDGQDWKAKAFAKEWVDKNENEIGKSK